MHCSSSSHASLQLSFDKPWQILQIPTPQRRPLLPSMSRRRLLSNSHLPTTQPGRSNSGHYSPGMISLALLMALTAALRSLQRVLPLRIQIMLVGYDKTNLFYLLLSAISRRLSFHSLPPPKPLAMRGPSLPTLMAAHLVAVLWRSRTSFTTRLRVLVPSPIS